MGRCITRGPVRIPYALGALVIGGLLTAATARANTAAADGVYGRLDGDFGIEPALGASYSRSALLPEIDIAASYVSTLGLRLRHADSKFSFDAGDYNRSDTAVEFELRPLFLTRWSQGAEAGPALLDLIIDSFTLGIGVYWEYDRSPASLQRGAELMTGFGVPLLASSNGPWLRATAALRLAEGPSFTHETHAAYALTLGWNFSLNSKLHDDSD